MITNTTIFKNASFFANDVHNHLCGNWQFGRILRTMEKIGVVSYVSSPIKFPLIIVKKYY